jgi:signal transduction histidine kinase/CheY-like chemotaxis protein
VSAPFLTVALRTENDVVVARQRARQLARHLGFDAQDQARVATAVSELARNVIQYAGRGRIEFVLEGRTAPQLLAIEVSDEGSGIADLEAILSGRYQSPTGMGIGLVGARRLMDQFQIRSTPGKGTTIHLRKLLPRGVPVRDDAAVRDLVDAIIREGLQNPLAEVQHQNQELMSALDELRRRQEELVHLNRELGDTNRGVVALYAELDEKAEHLRRADAMKTRFLSNMSHEFRTPLNSILAISRLMRQLTDGDLTAEQDKQLGFIVKSAQDLTQLVDDLLDIAKVEAGKIVVRPCEFELARMFGALRGVLRPLLVTKSVRLVFEEPEGIPPIYADEGKVSQILRNFLSNALKFTEKGEIRVGGTLSPDGERVTLSVSDTGIGIAPEDQARIFEEFAQVEHAVQKKVKGTGLGLALSRRLAQVLGGEITLQSAPGQGSTFALHLPMAYVPRPILPVDSVETEDGRPPVMVVEDDPASRHVYERPLGALREHARPASGRILVIDDDEASRYVLRSLAGRLGLATEETADGEEGTRRAAVSAPSAVLLDLVMPGLGGAEVLRRLRADPATARLPVVVATSKALDAAERRELEEMGAVVLPKRGLSSPEAGALLAEALRRAGHAAGAGAPPAAPPG